MRFSALIDYKKIQEETKNGEYIYTHSESVCCVYYATMLENDPQRFSLDFKNAFKSLLDVIYDDDDSYYEVGARCYKYTGCPTRVIFPGLRPEPWKSIIRDPNSIAWLK